jgi:hypothetical protein
MQPAVQVPRPGSRIASAESDLAQITAVARQIVGRSDMLEAPGGQRAARFGGLGMMNGTSRLYAR